MTSLITEEIVLTIPDGRALGEKANRININELQAGVIMFSVADITAAGLVRATATPIIATYNNVTVPVNNNGVVLPEITSDYLGRAAYISNISTTNVLLIYPYNITDTINGAIAGVPYALNAGDSIGFIADSLTAWTIIPGAGPTNGIIIGPNGNNFIGQNAGNTTLTGANNNGMGSNSLSNITSGSDNIADGTNSLALLTTGNRNIAIGSSTLASITNVSGLVAIGYQSLMNDTTGIGNTALGYQTLMNNTTGSFDTAIGYQVLTANNGSNNTGLGYQALTANTSGNDNTALGYQALFSNQTGIRHVAIGSGALASSVNVSDLVAVGYQALNANTTGTGNTAVGFSTMATSVAASNCTAIGANSLNNVIGSGNTALGTNAGQTKGAGVNCVAIGFNADRLGTGSNNVAIGFSAMGNNATGSNNIAIGPSTLLAVTTNANIAIGASALTALTGGTDNLAIGIGTLANSIVGNRNVGVGNDSLLVCIGDDNTGVGVDTLGNIVAGSGNIALGYQAGASLTAGDSDNIVVGNLGIAGDNNIIRIGTTQTKAFFAGIRGVTTDVADGIPLYISSTGQIGTAGATSPSLNSLAAFGSTPNANGASITGTSLQLQPADATNPGGVSISAQTFAGTKTFSGISFTPSVSVLSAYYISTLSVTWSNAVTPTVTSCIFERFGRTVMLTIPRVYDVKATAGAGLTINGVIPNAEFIPTTDSFTACMVFASSRAFASANDEQQWGVWACNNAGQMFIGIGIATTTGAILPFTNSGSGAYNGFLQQTICYSLY